MKGEQIKNHSSSTYLIPKGYTFKDSIHKNLTLISFMHQHDSADMNFDEYEGSEYLIAYASQEQFNHVIKSLNKKIKFLVIITSPKIENFSLLEGLANLEFVYINWNHKAAGLWNMKNNVHLKEIVLENCSKIHSLDDLETAANIRGLQLIGHWESKWRIDSFKPLSTLCRLEILRLFEIFPEHDGFEPLYKLKNLKQLDMSQNIFPTHEYAKLAAHLTNTCSEVFDGVIYSEYLNEIQFVGKGKRALALDKAGSKEKAEKFRAEFLDMVKSYQDE